MSEMSGRFLSSGRELTVDELAEYRHNDRVKKSRQRIDNQKKSFFWLGHRLGLPTWLNLSEMLQRIDVEGSAYLYHQPQVIPKPEGGVRIIISPQADLKLVQTRINQLLLKTFPRQPETFGYMGGSCLELAQRHLGATSTLKFDIKDAFFQVPWTSVRKSIRGFRGVTPGFSCSISHWIAKLCTYSPVPKDIKKQVGLWRGASSFLPQGAPTSPICFHLACGPLDKEMTKLAKRVGGVWSRYADNYYFSMPTRQFSKKLEEIIVCEARIKGFKIHKVRRVNEGELCRILGYNILDGRITNSRDFNRNLRGALYVLRTKLDRGLEYRDAYSRAKGFMGMSVNLPENLRLEYEYCLSRIKSI